MKITILTNKTEGGWSPADYHKGMLGGSEEAIILFAEELARRDNDVTVYHTKKSGFHEGIYNRVEYRDPKHFVYDYSSTLISFKSFPRLLDIPRGENPVIHWSCEVEKGIDCSKFDQFVHISDFHRSRHFFIPQDQAKVFPLGVDKALLDQNKVEQEPDSMLYCSSPDRGLANLLGDWKKIKEHYPKLKLRIAYGFGNIEKVAHRTPAIPRFIELLFKEMEQPDIEYLGALTKEDISKEYWRNKYWVHPLQIAESELFCLNAVKSQYCEAIPVVNKIGALRNTVGEYIKYRDFLEGEIKLSDISDDKVEPQTWSEVIDNYWIPLFNSLKKDEK